MVDMSTEKAFLRDICDNRDTDAPRLVFADWLEEQGQPERAQFIRYQCERARLAPWERRWRELVVLERPLLNAARKAQARYRVTGLSVDTADYRRGFPHQVSPTKGGLSAFHTGAAKLFATTPAELLVATLSKEEAVALADAPWLAHLSGLRVGRGQGLTLGTQAVRRIGASPHAGRLRAWQFDERTVIDKGVEALFASPLFDRLETLEFGLLNLGGAIVRSWVEAAERSKLREVVLSCVGLRPADVRALAGSGVLRTVASLDVSFNDS